jgi:hypothetical protein
MEPGHARVVQTPLPRRALVDEVGWHDRAVVAGRVVLVVAQPRAYFGAERVKLHYADSATALMRSIVACMPFLSCSGRPRKMNRSAISMYFGT